MRKYYLTLGSNMGDSLCLIKKALRRIEQHIGLISKCSHLYSTQAWGFESENNFLNIAVELNTDFEADKVLSYILDIEKQLGRIRDKRSKGYNSRTIDIDILLSEGLVIDSLNLQIPHPLMCERMFVLVPLIDIAPNCIHPVNNRSICELYNMCKDKNAVRKIGDSSSVIKISSGLIAN
ncbi:2-amino-4-hydroxy-6-hydroxymethyldihydropteridine diphosphokinase [Ichthyobacterium seriolicida]|uniref:2-amino-4-hydroxy-6-hydroxymethyldihydropteridine pyrophosphokinase n=1 Tax=Ichthyobacterium seriolicida TaxID=242600 RepID=A0A1J1EBM7_9FLAO|nr:2-amino-4-hydroxy-6-hydroxymethyldihydropteridine diphosphokinase [Ichthyobacterium seriolicida]BAV94912.1 2-amino-4-hydroxy-6-hydroxymethyldihydropteridine pyrophosphokinase [Ichthyobacterium seriolicida]